jgi:menaquinone-specific isochorismate synthase
LRQRHADCHIFSTANGNGQVFLGASPERLLRIRDRTLYTEAIAGSAPRGTTAAEDEQLGQTLSSSLKELHEHQLVVNFISQQLTQLGLEPQRSPFPRLLKLLNIQHLHTPIHANLTPELNALEVLALLHPTPAVAGVPQAPACALIQQQESFQRSLYAAPLGWINHRGDSEFIVGIRSALLDGSVSRLYAGAGIVRGSHPDQEMSEIELKLQTLLTALLF